MVLIVEASRPARWRPKFERAGGYMKPQYIGALIGLAFSAWLLVYLPMRANYERGGCVWLECGNR